VAKSEGQAGVVHNVYRNSQICLSYLCFRNRFPMVALDFERQQITGINWTSSYSTKQKKSNQSFHSRYRWYPFPLALPFVEHWNQTAPRSFRYEERPGVVSQNWLPYMHTEHHRRRFCQSTTTVMLPPRGSEDIKFAEQVAFRSEKCTLRSALLLR